MTSLSLDRLSLRDITERAIVELTAGIVCGVAAIVSSIGAGSLLFASGLQQYLPASIGVALFSTAVLAAVGAIAGSAKTTVALVQPVPAVALSGVLFAVAAAIPLATASEARFATVMVALAMGTGAIGLTTLLLGWLRLGIIVRFIPFPVIGGFLAGTGWLVMVGGIGIILGRRLDFDAMTHLPADAPLHLAVALAFVAALMAAQKRWNSPIVLPALILAGAAAFNAARLLLHLPGSTLRQTGWLIDISDTTRLWPAVRLADLAHVDWHAILAGALGVPSMVIVSIIALLMSATGIELSTRRDLDIDAELRTVGVMNLLSAAGGGAPGFNSFSFSLLVSHLGANTRLVGLVVAVVAAAALFYGRLVLDLIPTFILGGLLAWIGATQIGEWLVRSYRRVGSLEYGVILLIFVIIVWVNFAVGILTGLVAAAALFAFEYGRIDIVRHEMTGTEYQTGNDGSEQRRELLQAHGNAILIIRLQGYLFFGTADRLRRRVERRMRENGHDGARFLVVDFRRVSGLDSSAVLSFIRLRQSAEREGFTIVVTGLDEGVAKAMARGDFKPGDSVRFDDDIERGVKWCEDALLARISPDMTGAHSRPLHTLLADIVDDSGLIDAIAARCDRIDAETGHTIIERGAPSDDVFFIEAGHAAVSIPSETGNGTIRLATVGPGTIVGEIAFYLGEKRSASIVAEEPMTVWRFSRAAMNELQAAQPQAALRFHEGMAAILAKRLTRTNRIVRFLAD